MSQKINFAPIVTLNEFLEIRNTLEEKLVITSGAYDPLHPGHLSCIVASKEYGDILGVIVNGDSFLRDTRGGPFMNLEARCEKISAIRGVDFVIPYEVEGDYTVCKALEFIQPDVFTKGGNRVDVNTIPEWKVCVENKIEIVTGVGDSKVHSSSNILEDWYHRRLKLFYERQ